MLVVHDDVDLEEGRLQARLGGGLAGHNGLRSIAQALGSQEFLRLRIGVGRPGRGDRRSVADYVLAPFAPETDVDALVARSADAVEAIVRRRPRRRAAALQLAVSALRLTGLAAHRPDRDDVDGDENRSEHRARPQQAGAAAAPRAPNSDAAENERDQQDEPAGVRGDVADSEPLGWSLSGTLSQPSFE